MWEKYIFLLHFKEKKKKSSIINLRLEVVVNPARFRQCFLLARNQMSDLFENVWLHKTERLNYRSMEKGGMLTKGSYRQTWRKIWKQFWVDTQHLGLPHTAPSPTQSIHRPCCGLCDLLRDFRRMVWFSHVLPCLMLNVTGQ